MSQYTRFRFEGRRLWTTRGQRLASEGLRRGLEHVLAESRKIVPLEEGTLERSGRVDVDGLNGAVSYDTVYARRQHEELTWKHLPGRSAKYLEIPMNRERDVVLQLMAVPLRRWLRG
ncbi:minor capsid protein [Streptomyces cylindrosporus]|uniref:Minor capsid protein n=1 Tax=Streptomyces cylindrosporus TaxID=2927583 RepID=A0ABS9Y324_9ACTN|nr:minor capsid protein [Streptomyces cylindrosporus]MCI3271394.1 minor capsid protein [Streptomyces cylindrosporus]